MKRSGFIGGLFLLCAATGFSQLNITLSNPVAQNILAGNYNPAIYTPAVIINNPDSILHGIVNRVSKDTLIHYLQKIDSYHNRNSGSDTVSSNHGIGAVRRWIFSKFNEYKAACGNRLVVTYNDFDQAICGQGHHRNVLAILPGLDTANKEFVLVEGHFDTRCEGSCDTACYSPGMEDNGSGTVLVMELARVMSRYAYNHTIVFACVTGEDEGLWGARAFAIYCKDHNLKIRTVLNNDVIGGIVCGMTSSPPSCPYYNNLDSIHVRIFSYSSYTDSSYNSPHKQLARYIVLHQRERINPLLVTPMNINIIIAEDRTGRSGDHIPFRQRGYTSIRFTSQNEHGDGTGTPPDRQHSVRDILGVDTSVPPDGVIDSFFVDPGYLRRNIIMNGVNLGFLAIAPPKPDPEFSPVQGGIAVTLHGNDTTYHHYRFAIRSRGTGTLYFDTVMTFYSSSFTVTGLDPHQEYYFSVANVSNTVESLFSDEFSLFATGNREQMHKDWGINLQQNRPNPFAEMTEIRIMAEEHFSASPATLLVRDPAGGVVRSVPLELKPGTNVVTLNKSGLAGGIYIYSVNVGGRDLCSMKMVVTP
jgi:hypothetical protein